MRPRSRLTAHQSKRFVVRKQVHKYLSSFLLILGTALFVFCLAKISYFNFLTINKITINGIGEEIKPLIETSVKNIISGSYFGMFAKANSFIYPHDRLVADIQAALPTIQSLNVQRSGFSGLSINVVLKNPVAKICPFLPEFDEKHSLVVSDGCYLSDWTGQIFDKASTSQSSSLNVYFIPALVDLASSSHSLLLSYATSTDQFISLQKFYNGIRDAGLNPSFILIKDQNEFEMYANDVIIYFNNLHSLEDQLTNFVSFWNHKLSQKDNKQFEYIDVRYGTNVFYRLIQ